MKLLNKILIAFTLVFSFAAHGQMVLEYDINSPFTKITLPLEGKVNVTVDWGDGSASEIITYPGSITHTFTEVGVKKVTILGTLTAFGNNYSTTNHDRLTKVLSWDGLGLKSLAYAFYKAKNLTQVPTSLPNSINNLSYMFYYASSFNQSLDTWNTADVTDMSRMFCGAIAFNQSIGSWNTSAVTNMIGMFSGAVAFNQPIGDWNTLSVVNMVAMFDGASAFNQPIGAWNTSVVTNMSAMFRDASAFNQPIGNWNTAAVIYMSEMFKGASAFNQPIGSWNTSAVTNMSDMFSDARTFDQPIGSWNTASVINMNGMFSHSRAFNQSIGGWNTSAVKYMGDMFFDAIAFNQPIGSWNTSAVIQMYGMFTYASAFNQPIDSWDISSVSSLDGMFFGASAFNQPISSWNTSAVIDMSYMFYYAISFNQSIGTWNIEAVANMEGMFQWVTLCTDYYDSLLNGWASQLVKKDVAFDGGNSKFSSASATSRATLINKGWNITDLGMGFTNDTKCTNVGIEDEAISVSSKMLYPNPVKDKLSIHLPATNNNEKLSYAVFNATGHLVLEKGVQSNDLDTELELNNLPQGVYVLKIKTINSTIVHSFVKE